MDWIGSEKVSGGWIKLYRQLQDCWIWSVKEPFDKRSAWVDLLLLANHSDKKIVFNGEFITIKRGQILTSTRNLSAKWKWSVNKVYRFLKRLESDKMLQKESDKDRTLLTIVNYGIYQSSEYTNEYTNEYSSENTNEYSNRTITETPVETVVEHKQEYKECKNIKNNIIPPIPPSKVDTKKFIPPTVDEVREYCDERNKGVDPQAFVDYYESNGWHVGKNKMKDWKAAVRTWERNRNNNCYGNKQGKEVTTYESESTAQLW